jgi:formylglycine-generating enzyme required for sulfatase activity
VGEVTAEVNRRHTCAIICSALLAALALAACAPEEDPARCQIERRADPARVIRVQGDCSQKDFSGVDLSDADLAGVTWGDTATCPDGSRSGDHGGTCQGHLDPDDAPSPDLPEDDDAATDAEEDPEVIDIVDDVTTDQDAPQDLPLEEVSDVEDEEAPCPANACGGCGALAGAPGERCGPCGTGTWRCDGDDEVVCQDIPACTSRACVSLIDCPDSRDLCIDNVCTPAGTVLVPAGAYLRGSPTDELGHAPDEAQRLITLTRPIFVHISEYTHRLWDTDNGEAPLFERLGCRGEDCPLTNLNWYQVSGVANVASMTWGLEPCYTDAEGAPLPISDPLDSHVEVRWPAGYDCEGWRLPTDAEWEYFARAGTQTPWSSGDDAASLGAVAWFDGEVNAPRPVLGKEPNPWGLYDVHGNVAEYVWDDFAAIAAAPATDPLVAHDGDGVVILRGGHHDSDAGEVRSAARARIAPYFLNPDQERANIGFRLVRTVTPQP